MSRVNLAELKKEIAKLTCDITYWDDENNVVRTRKFYWGDFSATPCEWETIWVNSINKYMKRPIWYKDVKCNLIDMGY